MSSAYNLSNYHARYFEYKDLDKIHDEPDVDSVVKLLRQVKRNAQCVSNTRGGSQLGYLALVMLPEIYDMIPGSERFIQPNDPGTFLPVAPVGIRVALLTPGNIATQKVMFDEAERMFSECQAVKVMLRNQTIDVVTPEFLHPLQNTVMEMLNDNIPDILTFLTDTYGQLSPVELKEQEKQINNMIYDTSQGIDTVFNKIQEYQDLYALLLNPKTDMQLVTYAYLVFQKSGDIHDQFKRLEYQSGQSKILCEFHDVHAGAIL